MDDPTAWVYEDDRYDTKRHEAERAEKGYSVYDFWNFCEYIAWVNISALEDFKTGAGHPADLKSMDEWIAELDIMIDGFRAHIDMQNDWNKEKQADRMARYTKGMELYTRRLPTLWD